MKKILLTPKPGWKKVSADKKIDTKYHFTFKSFDKVKDFNKYDFILPLQEDDTIVLNQKAPELFGKSYIVPSTEVINICFDKKSFYEFMVKSGLEDYTPKISNDLTPPYVLKKREDDFGRNTFIIENEKQEEQYLEQLSSDEFFKQECILGTDEYTTHFMYIDGEFKYLESLMFRFPKQAYVKGINNPVGKAEWHDTEEKHEPLIKEMLDKLKFEGIGCINYKMRDDKPIIFEINARAGSTLRWNMEEIFEIYYSNLMPIRKSFFKRALSMVK